MGQGQVRTEVPASARKARCRSAPQTGKVCFLLI